MALGTAEDETVTSDRDYAMSSVDEHPVKNFHRANILDTVASSNAFFRSQQRGEKDLTFEEKREIADELLDRNHKLFLQRYWKYIKIRDTPFFDDVCNDYEVHFYLEEIRKCSNEKTRKAQCHNRRYQALKKLVSEGKYFSHEEMRERNPHLYEHLVGRYLSEEQKAELCEKKEPCSSFASFLIERIDRNCIESLRRRQEEEEDAAMEEEDDDDDDQESEIEDDDEEENLYVGNFSKSHIDLPEDEKQMLLTEFTNTMYESFLSGRDENFDYSSVDDNEEYDSVKEREVDEEEKYFDAD